MAQKRRTRGGRVTPSKKTLARTAGANTRSSSSSKATAQGPRPSEREDVAPSRRYTPAQPNFRKRPRWHRIAGWFGVLVGVSIAVLNDAMLFMEDGRLLPFGHQEYYLLLGIAVAASSTWFLGVFDRGTTIYD